MPFTVAPRGCDLRGNVPTTHLTCAMLDVPVMR